MERKIAMAIPGTYTQISAMETPFRYEIVMLKYRDFGRLPGCTGAIADNVLEMKIMKFSKHK
jgi:hypothetical protein